MSGVVPHSATLATQFDEYLKDSLKMLDDAGHQARTSPHGRGIYKISLATYCVLTAFSKRDLVLLKAAADIVRRFPLLAASRQRSLARVDLRRFIELVTWYAYFSEHPIEWMEFQSNPKTGFVRTLETPISYCAHRERLFYTNYVKERFGFDSSRLVVNANENLNKAYAELSFDVHAASHALKSTSFGSVLEIKSDDHDRDLQKIAKSVMASGCLVVAAVRPSKIHGLGPVERGWFDWLIGKEEAKKIRAGKFCSS